MRRLTYFIYYTVLFLGAYFLGEDYILQFWAAWTFLVVITYNVITNYEDEPL